MTAPTLVMAARGSRDQRVVRVAQALQTELSRMRPEVDSSVAFLDSCLPSVTQTLDKLAARGVRETVIVPLDLTHAIEVDPRFSGIVAQAAQQHPGLRISVARPIGPELLGMATGEGLAHINCLIDRGQVVAEPDAEGVVWYRAA